MTQNFAKKQAIVCWKATKNHENGIENDSNLNFTIDNFEMTNKQCKFTVKDVRIQQDKISDTTTEQATENQE